MVVGVPRELKDQENRVGIVPAGVALLTSMGHECLVEGGAGEGSSITDEEYRNAGAVIVDASTDVWAQSEIIVKVKEPEPAEYGYLRPGLTLFTYLHLAPLPELTQHLLDSAVTAIGYETVERDDGSLPLLEPMSEVAGRLAAQVGAEYLEQSHHGRGVLMGGVPGVAPAHVVVVGGGTVGSNAAKVALGTGARVTVIDKNLDRLRQIDDIYQGRISTLASNPTIIAESAAQADLLIGSVLLPGRSAPKLISREVIRGMRAGTVFVDVAIDQGGCSETSRPTTHSEPVYIVDGVLHYCVTNMPAIVPRTSTFALTNATLPYIQSLADKGPDRAMHDDSALLRGLNTYCGDLAHSGVAESQGRPWRGVRL